MTETARLSLPMIEPSQAQKHVTVNEALARLDGLVQLVLASVSTVAPPVIANDGDCYAVPVGGVNEWAGQHGMIAIHVNGGWVFAPAREGFRGYVTDQGVFATYSGSNWVVGAVASSPNGAAFIQEVVEFDHVLTAGPVSSEAFALPANSLVYGITGRVVDDVTGTLSAFKIGVSGSDNRYGSGFGLSAGSWMRGLTGAPMTYYSDEALVFTAEGGDFAGGTLRIAIHIARLTLPN